MHKPTDPACAAAELIKRRSVRNSLTEWARHKGFELLPKGAAFKTNHLMSDRLRLAREIAACTQPRFIEIKPEPRPIRRNVTISWWWKSTVHRGELTAMRGGLTAEEYRRNFIRKWLKSWP